MKQIFCKNREKAEFERDSKIPETNQIDASPFPFLFPLHIEEMTAFWNNWRYEVAKKEKKRMFEFQILLKRKLPKVKGQKYKIKTHNKNTILLKSHKIRYLR